MRFKLFDFPVIVEPVFFLLVLFLGARREGVDLVLIWVGVVFVSILVHELGHAFAGRRLGLSPTIRLHGMGGQTEWAVSRRLSHLQGVGISLAGPLAGFLLAGLVYQAQPLFAQAPDWRFQVVYYDLLWVNVVWGLLNLLPVLPLDGGHVMQSAVHAFLKRSDNYWPYLISTAFSGVGAALALLQGFFWTAALAGWLSYSSFQVIRRMSPTPFAPLKPVR